VQFTIATDGKTSNGSPALSSQQVPSSSSKGKGKKRKRGGLSDVTCYGCGKKGHVQHRCPDGAKKVEKRDGKGTDKQDDKGKVVAESESGNNLREVMTDNARALSMGEERGFCEHDAIKLRTTVLYHPASGGVAERAIWVRDSGLPDSLCQHDNLRARQYANESIRSSCSVRCSIWYNKLRAFGAPCAVVEPLEKLRKLDDWAPMCFFRRLQVRWGWLQDWDPRRQVAREACRRP
jgi:hypothetical protein